MQGIYKALMHLQSEMLLFNYFNITFLYRGFNISTCKISDIIRKK